MSSRYVIHVIQERGNSHSTLFVYTAETHPQPADRVVYSDESYLVNGVRHVLRRDAYGNHKLDYVEVRVY